MSSSDSTPLVGGAESPSFVASSCGWCARQLADLHAGRAPKPVVVGLSCGFFMVCSAGMMIVNKLVTRSFSHLDITVVMIQMTFSSVVLSTIFHWTLHFGSRRDVLRWACIVPFLYSAMLATSMLALANASMGAMTVVRNISPLLTLPIERAFQEKIEVDVWTWVSLVVILAGVILYCTHDMYFTPLGFFLMILNMVIAILERLMQRKMIAVEPIDVSKTGMLLLNNAVGLLPETVLLLCFKEPWRWHHFSSRTPVDYVLLFLSCFVGVAIGWSAINAQSYITATTMMVLGNVNKFVVIAFGIAFLNEASSWQAIIGCIIALGGGVFYARSRALLAARKREEAERALAKGNAPAGV